MKPHPTILEKIFKAKRVRVEKAKKGFDYGEFVRRAKDTGRNHGTGRFRAAFTESAENRIIAEIKRASPSAGLIVESADAGQIAQMYESCGAAAVSVLTEEDFFGGSVEDLLAARNLTDLPILRKDFMFDEFQVYESALIAADAILLIAAMLDERVLGDLYALASGLGLDVVVEIHNLPELERAKAIGAKIIGVNNRDLNTFEVSLDISRDLIKHSPPDALMIAESGLRSKADLTELRSLGFGGFLIGEALLKAEDPGEKLLSLL